MANELLDNISEIEITGLTIYGEARNQSLLGQAAVGCVIRNRVLKSDDTYQRICLKPRQFSCWNENDPNRAELVSLAEQLIHNDHVDNPALNQCIFVAGGIVNNHILDVTNNALNYVTAALFRSPDRPSWTRNAANITQIDSHIFFNA